MKKKVLIICISVIIVCCYATRVYYINAAVEKVPLKLYKIGEVIPYEDDFANASTCKGYTIQILECDMLNLDEFCKKYGINEDDLGEKSNLYVTIKMLVGNTNTEQSSEYGVSLYELSLLGTNYKSEILDETAFDLLNPDMPDYSFSLRPHSSLEMIVVYSFGERSKISKKDLIKDKPRLGITEYPHRKMVELEF